MSSDNKRIQNLLQADTILYQWTNVTIKPVQEEQESTLVLLVLEIQKAMEINIHKISMQIFHNLIYAADFLPPQSSTTTWRFTNLPFFKFGLDLYSGFSPFTGVFQGILVNRALVHVDI